MVSDSSRLCWTSLDNVSLNDVVSDSGLTRLMCCRLDSLNDIESVDGNRLAVLTRLADSLNVMVSVGERLAVFSLDVDSLNVVVSVIVLVKVAPVAADLPKVHQPYSLPSSVPDVRVHVRIISSPLNEPAA